MSQLINEAFKELKGIDLDEELFSFDERGAQDLSRFLDSTSDPVLDIIDPLASSEEELQSTYEGNVICQCCVCKQLIYKKPEDVIIDEETQSANVGEECPHCYNTRGFKVIGQVEPYFDKDEVKVTVDDDQVDVQAAEDEEVEPVTESLKESQEDGEVDIDDFIGLRGIFKGYSADDARQLYDTWDDRRKRPTDPDELEDFRELKEMYGKTVEIIGCSIFTEGSSPADTFNKSYWDIEITEGTFKDGTNMAGLSLSGVSGHNIDLYDDLNEGCKSMKEDTVKTKKGWVNKGKAGTHGTFKTKKAADAQRRAMYASGWKGECLEEAKDDRAEPDKISIEVVESDIHHFDEDTGDVIIDEKKFAGKNVQEGDYVTLHFADENEDAGTQDYKFIRKTDLGYQLEWIGTDSLYEKLHPIDEKNLYSIEAGDVFETKIGKITIDKIHLFGFEELEPRLDFSFERGDGTTGDDSMSLNDFQDMLKRQAGTKLTENFQKATVETGDSVLSMESNDEGKITVTSEPRKAEEGGEEMMVPISDEVKAEIESNNTEEEAAKAEVEIDDSTEEAVDGESGEETEVAVDEFEESYFNELGKKYLQEVYSNVESYETTRGTIDKNRIKLEGIITFSSGKKVKTNFIFESKEITKKGKVKFLGENTQITGRGKAFTLCGSLKQGKLLAESLTYNYRAKDATTGRSVKLYGTVKR